MWAVHASNGVGGYVWDAVGNNREGQEGTASFVQCHKNKNLSELMIIT